MPIRKPMRPADMAPIRIAKMNRNGPTVITFSIHLEKKAPVKKEAGEGLGADAAAVYGVFGIEPLHPDEICAMSGLPLPKVISALMQLEIAGLIEQTDGKNYAVCG